MGNKSKQRIAQASSDYSPTFGLLCLPPPDRTTSALQLGVERGRRYHQFCHQLTITVNTGRAAGSLLNTADGPLQPRCAARAPVILGQGLSLGMQRGRE